MSWSRIVVHAWRRRVCRGVAYLQQHVLLLGNHVHAVLKVVTAKVDSLHQYFLIAIDLREKEGRREERREGRREGGREGGRKGGKEGEG